MMTIDGTNGVTFPDTSVQAKAVPAAPQSMVRLNSSNGYGSTNTAIRRWAAVTTNQGTDITYSDSATLGASFTTNTAGVYAISYTDNFNSASSLGISLNTSQPATAIVSIASAEALAICTTSGANAEGFCGWTGYLPAGSVIRAHASLQTAGVNPNNFTITRVA